MAEETKKIEVSNRVFILLSVLSAGIIVLFLGNIFYNFASLPENTPQQLVVSGSGKIYSKPDIASINIGVKTDGKKSNDVVNENNQKMNSIISAVKGLGVDEKDIQTTSYSLYPQYNYTEKEGRVFQGYTLNQQITVKIRDFTKISDVLDKATSNGANNIGDVSFSIENPENVKAQARQKAIDDAKQKAKDIASASGLYIKLVNISEGSSGYYAPTTYAKEISSYGAGLSSIAPDIQTGQEEVSVNVSLTYRIK